MADTDTATPEVDAPTTAPSTILQIAISKAGASLDVDTSRLPDAIYTQALAEGLKVLLNLGAVAKVKPKGLEGAELDKARADALKAAQANLDDLYAGKTRRKASSKTKAKSGIDREVTTEAMRIARNMVKDEIKAAGLKVSHYAASEITKQAKIVLDENPAVVEMAKENIAKRSNAAIFLNVKAIPTDAKAIAAAEKKKAENKPKLSATQAGMTAKSRKGKGAQANA